MSTTFLLRNINYGNSLSCIDPYTTKYSFNQYRSWSLVLVRHVLYLFWNHIEEWIINWSFIHRNFVWPLIIHYIVADSEPIMQNTNKYCKYFPGIHTDKHYVTSTLILQNIVPGFVNQRKYNTIWQLKSFSCATEGIVSARYSAHNRSKCWVWVRLTQGRAGLLNKLNHMIITTVIYCEFIDSMILNFDSNRELYSSEYRFEPN